MAEYNVKINVKTDTGYDQLYPKSKSDIIDFDKTSSNLSSTNVEAAIKEVNTKANTNKTNIGTLTSLTTNSKTNLVGAINEVDSHANTAQSTANTNKKNIGTLSSLKTTIKTSIVNAINWLYDNVVHKTSVIDNLDDIVANQADGMVAGAKAVAELNSNLTPQILQISVNSENVDTSFGYIVAGKYGNVIVVSGTVRVKKAVGVYSGITLASGLPIPIGAKAIYGSAISKDGAYASCIFEIGHDGKLNLDSRSHSVNLGDTFLGQIVYLCQ